MSNKDIYSILIITARRQKQTWIFFYQKQVQIVKIKKMLTTLPLKKFRTLHFFKFKVLN
jgi:hypothetical protein